MNKVSLAKSGAQIYLDSLPLARSAVESLLLAISLFPHGFGFWNSVDLAVFFRFIRPSGCHRQHLANVAFHWPLLETHTKAEEMKIIIDLNLFSLRSDFG